MKKINLSKKKSKIVIIRHGQSKWNEINRTTGWTDIDLSKKGYIEAIQAGKILKREGYFFDCAYTSVLKRAIHTLWKILDVLDQVWLPIEKTWYLNDQYNGIFLQNYQKEKLEKKQKEIKTKKLHSNLYNLTSINKNFLCKKGKQYIKNLDYTQFSVEDFKSLENRVFYFWKKKIMPKIKSKKTVIIVAHSNSIRAIRKFLDSSSNENIKNLEIPNGVPLIYEFDKNSDLAKFNLLK